MNTQPIHAVPRFLLAFILAFSLSLPTAGLAYATPDEESTPLSTSEAQQPDSTASDDADSGAGEGNGAHSHDLETDQAASPCIPSEEDIAKWEADGTLDERIAFQESLGNGEVSSALIAQAIQRATGPTKLRFGSNNLPSNVTDDLSMATTGEAKVLALRVTFEAEEDGTVHKFVDGDNLAALQNLIGSPYAEPETGNNENNGAATEPSEGTNSEGDSSSEDQASTDPLSSDTNETASAPNSDWAPYDSLNAYYKRSSYGRLDISGKAFEYSAPKPRSAYTYDIDGLFLEALEYLHTEEGVNLADYDADKDGYIDAVYLHFAGENNGWGNTWWSNCSFYQEDPYDEEARVYDLGNMKLGCMVTLHNPSNSKSGVITAIHETGHALGLPDYYTYSEGTVKPDPSLRTGILTFDMMKNNIGDHNAYSKWLLGWIDDSKITRVVANNSGITVKKGDFKQLLGNDAASYEAAVALLATDNMEECGGFIAVSNNDILLEPLGLFSSFYLLEYNGYAGNQIVEYRAGYANGGNIIQPIPTGFRMFRIQAELDPWTNSFIHENRYDDVHNQFIELVDHDGSMQHTAFQGIMEGTNIEGTGWAPFGCMMTAGDIISPAGVFDSANPDSSASYPSTNFFESLSMGFTGLTIEVLDSSDTQGKVAISYSDERKPDISPASLELSVAESRGVDNIDVVELKSTVPIMEAGMGLVYVKAQDTCSVAMVDDVDGTSVTISYTMPPEFFVPGENCEVVFPAGYFFIGYKDGESIYSDELRVELPVKNTVPFDEVGDYIDAKSDTHVISNVVTSTNGKTYFAIQEEGRINLCAVDPDDPTTDLVSNIQGIDAFDASRLHLETFPDGSLCLITATYYGGRGYINEAHWVDPATATVTGYAQLSLGDISTYSTYDDTLVITKHTTSFYYEIPPYLEIEAYGPESKDEGPSVAYTVHSANSVHKVSNSNGEIAVPGYPGHGFGGTVKIIDLPELINSDRAGGSLDFSEVAAKTTLDISIYSGASAFASYKGGYLALAYDEPEAAGSPDTTGNTNDNNDESNIPAWRGSSKVKGYLVSFESSGSALSSYLFATFPMRGVSFDSLSISPKGTPAAEITLDADRSYGDSRRVLFFRDSITSAPINLSNESTTHGTWLENDAWLDISFNFPNKFFFNEDELSGGDDGALGSPDLSSYAANNTGSDEGIIDGSGDSLEEDLGQGEGDDGYYDRPKYPVHYLLAFLPDSPEDGDDGNGDGNGDGDTGTDPKPDPIPGTPSDGADGSSDKGGKDSSALSKAGDPLKQIMIICTVASMAAITLAVVAFRALRRQKRR